MQDGQNEQKIFGIPVTELSIEPVKVKNGIYYNFKGYNVFVPDEVNASTSAFIYYPGAGGSGAANRVIGQLMGQGEFNQILIVADDPYIDKRTNGARHFQLIDNIGAANGVEITKIDSMGFSAGGPTNFKTLMYNVENYPDNGPHNAVFCDVIDFPVTQENINMLVEDGSSLLFMEPISSEVTKFQDQLAKGGVDVVIAYVAPPHSEHSTLNKEALMNGIINFASGESDKLANSDIYIFKTYDKNTGQWHEISLSEVAEKFANTGVVANPFRYYDKLRNMSTELQCNNSFLGGKINTIRTAIKNTNFLSTTSMEYYNSTTQIPNAEGDIVQAYFSACAKALNCLEGDTAKIIEIGNSIDEINDNLKGEAQNLNASIDYYTNNAGNTNNTGSNGNSWADSSSYSGNLNSELNGDSYGGSNGSDSESYSGAYSGANVAEIGGLVTTTINENTDFSSENKITPIKKEFLDYNSLCSDSEQNIFVFRNIEKSCKVVVHYNNDEILNVEHYYQFSTSKEATDSMNILKEQYGNKCEDILRETNTLKVIVDKSEYKDLTTTNLIEQYKKSGDMIAIMERKSLPNG